MLTNGAGRKRSYLAYFEVAEVRIAFGNSGQWADLIERQRRVLRTFRDRLVICSMHLVWSHQDSLCALGVRQRAG
jgi:hypothetical protein